MILQPYFTLKCYKMRLFGLASISNAVHVRKCMIHICALYESSSVSHHARLNELIVDSFFDLFRVPSKPTFGSKQK